MTKKTKKTTKEPNVVISEPEVNITEEIVNIVGEQKIKITYPDGEVRYSIL